MASGIFLKQKMEVERAWPMLYQDEGQAFDKCLQDKKRWAFKYGYVTKKWHWHSVAYWQMSRRQGKVTLRGGCSIFGKATCWKGTDLPFQKCEYFGSAVLTKIKCLGFILSTMIVGFQLANHHRDDRISRHFFFNVYSYSTLLKELLTVNTTTHHT